MSTRLSLSLQSFQQGPIIQRPRYIFREKGKTSRNYTVHAQYHEFCLKEMPLNT